MGTTTFTSTIGTRSPAKQARGVKEVEVVGLGQQVEAVVLGQQVEVVDLGQLAEATLLARSLLHQDQSRVRLEQNQAVLVLEQRLAHLGQVPVAQELNRQVQEQSQVHLDHQGQAPVQALVRVLLDQVQVLLNQLHLQLCTWLLSQIFTMAQSHSTCTMCANCQLMMEF